jgi:hypothetical protein
MDTTSQGNSNGDDRQGRRARAHGPKGVGSRREPVLASEPDGFWSSGRVLVTALVLGTLVFWGSLQVAFRYWRAGYRERAAYGARYAAGALEPFATAVPSDVTPDAWRATVAATRAMLLTLTASNVLDDDGLQALAADVAARAARVRPETARGELSTLWDDIEHRAAPIIRNRHPRPALLVPGKNGGVEKLEERKPATHKGS